jgi:hypothetical protein
MRAQGEKTMDWKESFLVENSKIEGIELNHTELMRQRELLNYFLDLPELEVYLVCAAAERFAGKRGILRNKVGEDVMVGDYVAPKGGPGVRESLELLVREVKLSQNRYSKGRENRIFHNHMAFEKLHPFMDGNGRTGRLLWVWEMEKAGFTWWREIGFLHAFYYQTLKFS